MKQTFHLQIYVNSSNGFESDPILVKKQVILFENVMLRKPRFSAKFITLFLNAI